MAVGPARTALLAGVASFGLAFPAFAGDKPARQPFKRYPIGFFHIDIAELRTEEGKLYLFVAVDRTSK